MRKRGLALAVLGIVGIVFLPVLGVHLWRERNEWFPMRLGDRWTYVDAAIPQKVVFEVIRREPDGAFVVERRVGSDVVTFVLAVTSDSVTILSTSKGSFDRPFEEFRLPPVEGMTWGFDGAFAGQPLRIVSRVDRAGGFRCQVVEESSLSGRTTFDLERGKGVVRLQGKGNDPHGLGPRVFDWTLEKFERGDRESPSEGR